MRRLLFEGDIVGPLVAACWSCAAYRGYPLGWNLRGRPFWFPYGYAHVNTEFQTALMTWLLVSHGLIQIQWALPGFGEPDWYWLTPEGYEAGSRGSR